MARSSYTNITLVVLYFIFMFQASNKLSSTLNANDIENAVDSAAWSTDRNKNGGRMPTLEYLTGNPKNISCPSPLVPVYDRIVEDIYLERKIPRAIHVSMVSVFISLAGSQVFLSITYHQTHDHERTMYIFLFIHRNPDAYRPISRQHQPPGKRHCPITRFTSTMTTQSPVYSTSSSKNSPN
jgi:hypothetical protein